MTRTWFLAVIAAAAGSMQLIPAYAGPIKWVAIVSGVLYLMIRALKTYPKQYRLRKQRKAQVVADDSEYFLYSQELISLREKYTAAGAETGSGMLVERYEAEVALLHDRHRAMLERKFGVPR